MASSCARAAFAGSLFFLASLTSIAPAHAIGALVIGACGAWGGSWNYDNEADARRAALKECKGERCRVVVVLRNNCVAFAYDYGKDCGGWGWATRDSREAARRVAIQECENAGGKECRIRAQFCDGGN